MTSTSPPLIEDLQPNQIGSSLKKKVYVSIAYSQIPYPKFRNRLGKVRSIEANLLLLRVERKAKAGLQQQGCGSGGPGLGSACHRIQSRSLPRTAISPQKSSEGDSSQQNVLTARSPGENFLQPYP